MARQTMLGRGCGSAEGCPPLAIGPNSPRLLLAKPGAVSYALKGLSSEVFVGDGRMGSQRSRLFFGEGFQAPLRAVSRAECERNSTPTLWPRNGRPRVGRSRRQASRHPCPIEPGAVASARPSKSSVHKPLWLVPLLLLSLVFLSSCQPQAESRDHQTPILSRIQSNAELVVGTAGNMPPMNMRGPDGELQGFDIDIARLMAESMGVKLRIETMPFAELLPALQAETVDVVISNMTITPQRNLQVAFVGPYLESGKCVLTKQPSIAEAEEIADLDVPGVRFTALAGSTSEEFVRALLPQVTLTLTESLEQAVAMVEQRRADALLTDYPICASTLQNSATGDFISAASLLTYEPIGIALSARDPLLINWTENFLQRMEHTGVLETLRARWLNHQQE